MMKRTSVILLIAVLAIVVYDRFGQGINLPDDSVAASEEAISSIVARDPFDFRYLPNDIYENICILDHPILITGWDLDPDTRFLIFKGPFIASADDENPEVYPYVYKAIESLSSSRVTSSMLLASIDEFKAKAVPEDMEAFKLPIIRHGLPEDPSKLAFVLGEPSIEQSRDGGNTTRLIYQKPLCFGGKLLAGLYIDVADETIIRAKGIETDVRLDRLSRRDVLPDPDPEPIRYVDTKPLLGSAQETFVEFILSRESGDQAAALGFVSDSQTSSSIRDLITRQSEPGVEISLESLTYQTTEYEWGSVKMTTVYSLENGSLIKSSHRLLEEDDGWRLKY